MLTAHTVQGGLITADHPYYRNLPAAHERLSCPCGAQAVVLLLFPGHRLERCRPCHADLAQFLDPSCSVIHVGARADKDVLSLVRL